MERTLLEVLKYLTAAEVLHLASVSRLWLSLSLSQEVWVCLLGPEGLLYYREMHPQPTLQEAYRAYYSKVCYAIRERVVYRYNLARGQWTTIPLAIDCSYSFIVTLSLTRRQLFVLQPGGEAFIISLPSGSIEVLPSRPNACPYPGLCLFQSFIYAFGGKSTDKCYNFALQTKTWGNIVNCKGIRYAFNPVIYQTLIYLCGGHNYTIETFDPPTHVFRLLQYRTYIHLGCTTNLIHENKLILLGTLECYIVNLDSGVGERKIYHQELKNEWEMYKPVLSGREILLDWGNFLWKLIFVDIYNFEAILVAIPRTS